MLRVRMILTALCLALIYAQYEIFLYTDFFGFSEKIILHAAGAILFLAGFVILCSTFLKIEQTPDGGFCYDSENPYWKFMQKFSGDLWSHKNSLCKAYWINVLLFLIAFMALTLFCVIVSGLYLVVVHLITNGAPSAKLSLFSLGFALAFSALIYGGILLERKFARLFNWICGTLFILAIFLAAIILPFMFMMNRLGMSFSLALYSYLWWLVLIVICILGVIGLVKGAFKYIPMLKNSALGKFLQLLKSGANFLSNKMPP